MASDLLGREDHGRSICHLLPPRIKLLLALFAVLTAVIAPPRFWPIHGALFALVAVGHALARTPLAHLARRLAAFLMMMVPLAASFPLLRGWDAGGDVGIAIAMRSTVSFLVALWLANVMPFEQLLSALNRMRMPTILVAVLAMMYRYLFVLADELDRMRTARAARSFGRSSAAQRWRTSGQMIGMLVIRSMDRAERVHGAMCARGWDGHVRTLDG